MKWSLTLLWMVSESCSLWRVMAAERLCVSLQSFNCCGLRNEQQTPVMDFGSGSRIRGWEPGISGLTVGGPHPNTTGKLPGISFAENTPEHQPWSPNEITKGASRKKVLPSKKLFWLRWISNWAWRLTHKRSPCDFPMGLELNKNLYYPYLD